MGRPVAVTKVLTAASATAVAAAQAVASSKFLTINGSSASGGVATLDTQRRVLITSAGDDRLITFAVTGTREGGGSINETVSGSNGGTVVTNLDFLTVTSVFASGAAAGNVSVGTNATGSSRWIRFDPHLTPPALSYDLELVSGSGTSSVEETYDEFLAPPGAQSAIGYQPATTIPVAVPNPQLQGMTSSGQSLVNYPIAGWRLTITAGTGPWRCTCTQAGII